MKIKSNLFEFEGRPIELLILIIELIIINAVLYKQIVIDYTK